MISRKNRTASSPSFPPLTATSFPRQEKEPTGEMTAAVPEPNASESVPSAAPERTSSISTGRSATVSVRVVPRASREGVAGFEGGVVRIRLNAPPVEGQANDALVRFLAKAVGVPRSRVTLVTGERGRSKIVRVAGVTREELMAALGL